MLCYSKSMTELKRGIHVTVCMDPTHTVTENGVLERVEEAPTLEQVVDADIAEFEEYFCKMLKNSSLAAPEKAILKTYLYWKTHPAEPSGSAV